MLSTTLSSANHLLDVLGNFPAKKPPHWSTESEREDLRRLGSDAPLCFHRGEMRTREKAASRDLQGPSRRTMRALSLVVILTLLEVSSATAREWNEQIFTEKPGARPYLAVASRDPKVAHSVVGSSRFYQAQKGDTLLDVARYYGLGYNEIEEANPGVDPWIPPQGQVLVLPTEFVLPDTPYNGLVLNIPEMRLYYYQSAGNGTTVVITYPVGLGRDEWRTPAGAFKVTEKDVNPKWVLPESIKAEHRRDGRPAPDFIPGGDPDNPLGKYRLQLSLPLYGIHGTDIPWGVGMQVSHGCVRLYPEDIERLYPRVPIGTPGEFTYQAIKFGR